MVLMGPYGRRIYLIRSIHAMIGTISMYSVCVPRQHCSNMQPTTGERISHPVLPLFLAPLRTIYAMMGTMFIQQGSMMERNVQLPWTNMSVYIPSATMALFNTGGCNRLVVQLIE